MGKKKRKKKKEAKKREKKQVQQEEVLTFGKKNYLTFAGALASIIIGFVMLAKGSITAAPILLVLGYVILVPLSLILK